MSLIDAVTAIMAEEPGRSDDSQQTCIYCSWGYRDGEVAGQHHPDCPWLALPKIGAVLEAAEQVTTFHQMSFGFDHTHPRYMGPDLDNCTRCLGEFRLPAALESLRTALEAS